MLNPVDFRMFNKNILIYILNSYFYKIASNNSIDNTLSIYIYI